MIIVCEIYNEPDCWASVGKTFIIENYKKAQIFVDLMQTIKDDEYLEYEILDTDEAIKVNEIGFEDPDNGTKLIINPKNGEKVTINTKIKKGTKK